MARNKRGVPLRGELYRTNSQLYKALSQVKNNIIKRDLAASFSDMVLAKADRHTLLVRNLSGLNPEIASQSNPAAGATFTVTVPAGELWEIFALYARLVTDATAASRIAVLHIDTGTDDENVYSAPPHAASVASTTRDFQWPTHYSGESSELGSAAIDSQGRGRRGMYVPMLSAGHRLRVQTVAIQAGDQWSRIRFFIRRYIELRLSTVKDSADFLTLLPPREPHIKFDIHYGGLQADRQAPGFQKGIFHCEWDDALFIKNQSATSVCPIEVYEVS